ncbi:MAG: GGDEF domain-containing protein, partial [Cyanobacteriota bacterium]
MFQSDKLKKLLLTRAKVFIILGILFLPLIIFFILYYSYLQEAVNRLEILSYDIRLQFSNSKAKSFDKDIINILYTKQVNSFISKHSEKELIKGEFPESVWADINSFLLRGNTLATVYDVQFSNDPKYYQEQNFIKSFQSADNSYLAFTASPLGDMYKDNKLIDELGSGYSAFKKVDLLIEFLQASSAKKIIDFDAYNNVLKKFYRKITIDNNNLSAQFLLNISFWNPSLPYFKLADVSKGIGIANTIDTEDSIVRSSKLFGRFNKNEIIPSLSLAPVLNILPKDNTSLSLKNNLFVLGDKKIPLDSKGNFFINWRNYNSNIIYRFESIYLYEKYYTTDPRNGFNILPEEENYFLQPEYQCLFTRIDNIEYFYINYLEYYKIRFFDKFKDIKISKNEEFKKTSDLKMLERLSNYDNRCFDISAIKYPLNNYIEDLDRYNKALINPQIFTGKIVVIGEEYSLDAIHHINIGNIPGPITIATIIDNLLNDDSFIRKSSNITNFFIYALLIIISLLILKNVKDAILNLFIFIGIILIYLEIIYEVFLYTKLWIPAIWPVFVVSIFYFIGIITQNLLTKELLSKTYKLATTDGLTGLYNHRYFQEKITSTLEKVKRKEDSFSILLLDIDYFKKFNDTYGHRAGDSVLIQVSEILKKSVRTTDIVCRYGGEEMCIILDKTVTSDALEVANKIVRAIERNEFKIQVDQKTKDVHVTVSIGVANYPAHGNSVPELIEFADQGLYRAKEGGRNRIGELDESEFCITKLHSSVDLEISRAKIIKEADKIHGICVDKNIDYKKVMEELLEYITSKYQD